MDVAITILLNSMSLLLPKKPAGWNPCRQSIGSKKDESPPSGYLISSMTISQFSFIDVGAPEEPTNQILMNLAHGMIAYRAPLAKTWIGFGCG